ncbi:MAG: ABC transporter permease [Clostridia bacterium]|nr:ABC transporter permease [Clostridia bacterium]
MLTFVLRKMLKNKWMVLCLLVGYILVIAMVSSVPIYTDAILQKMLTGDLESHQKETGRYSGNYRIDLVFHKYLFNGQDIEKLYNSLNDKFTNQFSTEYRLPFISKTQELTVDNLKVEESVKEAGGSWEKEVNIKSLQDMEEHVRVIHGNLFSQQKSDSTYEVIITEKASKELNFILDKTYGIMDSDKKRTIKVKVVGIFAPREAEDAFWYKKFDQYAHTVFIAYPVFKKDFIETKPTALSGVTWNFSLDYHRIAVANINDILSSYDSQLRWLSRYNTSIKTELEAEKILKQYFQRKAQLKVSLLILIAPVLIVLVFYIFMVSRLIIKQEENEIALLKSRGAGRLHILRVYTLEGIILGGTALLLGPALGLALCTIIGSSNGFLEFVQRTALPVRISSTSIVYSVCAALFLVLTMVLSAFLSTRVTIVQHKQNKAAGCSKPVWMKYFVDIMILVLSIYGLYRYNMQQKILQETGLKGMELGVDPLLFLISTFFILGTGLLFLRCYPSVLRLIFFLGSKRWSPVVYMSFMQVGRSRGQEQFLMLFLIFALSTGVFSANSARTINRNLEDKVKYEMGADVTLKPIWGRVEGVSDSDTGFNGLGSSYNAVALKKLEPPFEPYKNLDGVETATKVFLEEGAKAQLTGSWINNVRVMGIIPGEFGKVASMRSDLLPHHWYEYLNIISGAKKGFLVSRSFEKAYKAKVGDPITISYARKGIPYTMVGTIYAFVDFWPGFNPYIKEKGKDAPMLVVGNLPYIQQMTTVEPYEVWLKKEPEATDEQLYSDITRKSLAVESVSSAKQVMIKMKNDPALQGINGSLTLGFIVIMVIVTIGFVIYWILSIHGRVLQFGIFRAIGLSMRKINKMLIFEQFLISGVSIVVGITLGSLTGDLFTPLLKMVYSASEMILPFKVTASSADYTKILIIVALMLLLGFTVLYSLLSRIRINQAIKLGED